MSLSVIIPVHNSEDYLKECVESVLPGLYREDEIILVENGSSIKAELIFVLRVVAKLRVILSIIYSIQITNLVGF